MAMPRVVICLRNRPSIFINMYIRFCEFINIRKCMCMLTKALFFEKQNWVTHFYLPDLTFLLKQCVCLKRYCLFISQYYFLRGVSGLFWQNLHSVANIRRGVRAKLLFLNGTQLFRI